MPTTPHSSENTLKASLRITWIGLVANVVLATIKCTVGILTHSQALIGDGFHSLSDLSSDFVTLFGLKISTKPKDEDHHYGHGKFSSLCSLFIAALLIFFCTGLIYSSLLTLFRTNETPLDWPVLLAAAVSIVVKEILYWQTRFLARRFRSRLLMINAWHHRTDSFSSLLILIALGMVVFAGEGWLFLDEVAGLFMGLYLGYQSLKLIRDACNDLLDTAPEKEIINDFREHILPTPGALAYHDFRVRQLGDMFEVDLHLQIDSQKTVEEGHAIASEVKKNILERHDDIIDVLIHIEPASPKHIKSQGISDRSL